MVLLRSIITVGGFTMMSRILGFVRDILVAAFLGAGAIADAFFVAFKMPNFFRRLFAEGAFNAAFVPLFAAKLTDEGLAPAASFAAAVLSVMVTFLLVFVTALQIAMPWLMYVFAPGFADDPEKFGLAVDLTRITFPYLLFISLVSLLGGVLNSLGRFAAAAATPIILNIVLIGALLLATPYLPSAGHSLAWGVAVAGVVQFLWLMTACRREGVLLRLRRPRLSKPVRRLLKLMVPGAIGAGVVQINLLIDIVIASILPTGAISLLYYADRINQLPLGVVGVAVGTALLPLLSKQIRAGEDHEALNSMNRAIEIALLFTIPGAAALLIIGHPIVSVLFERGAFDSTTSIATAQALMAYAIGLPAYVLIKVLAPGFFARQDTATPVKIAILCVLINVVLNLTLIQFLAHVGIALATAISAWINALLLVTLLQKRGQFQTDSRLRQRTVRIILAAAGMAAALWFAFSGLQTFYADGPAAQILVLAILVFGGMAFYFALVVLFRAASLEDVKSLLRRKENDKPSAA
ncbi:MAG: murein biosynthesis integral membrane protein MurJ [Rhodospirillaceae bacterium]|nr:murein biosynthesis integral membrane protein MurJ [Rhodospirillaceae bacterium]|tara:strand:+ start:21470 stop:23038 length:1569 start_codon:yes stop_codon:yes gene_type:complete